MIQIRNANFSDLEKVMELEETIWPEGTRASREKFMSRLKIFPDGFFVAYKNGEMIGISTSEIINYQPEKLLKSWEEITDNGFIRKTHNPNGNALYVVSIGAISRSGGGSVLLESQKDLARKVNLQFLVLGARIPGYDLYCREKDEIYIEDYIKLRKEDGNLLDPELRFYTRNGLRILRVQENYMQDDKESRNYGAIMLWENTDR